MNLLRFLRGRTVWPECPGCGREGEGLPVVDLIDHHGAEGGMFHRGP